MQHHFFDSYRAAAQLLGRRCYGATGGARIVANLARSARCAVGGLSIFGKLLCRSPRTEKVAETTANPKRQPVDG
jgi:hypothetical protein